jgi:hypothetical protein
VEVLWFRGSQLGPSALTVSKHTPVLCSQGQVSVFPYPILQFSAERSECHVIWRVCMLESHTSSSQHMQPRERSWRLNFKPATGSALCFYPHLSRKDSLLGRDSHSSDHWVPYTASIFSYSLKFSEGQHQTLSLSLTTSHGRLTPRLCVTMSQDSLSHECSLFSGSHSISASNNRPSIKMAH